MRSGFSAYTGRLGRYSTVRRNSRKLLREVGVDGTGIGEKKRNSETCQLSRNR